MIIVDKITSITPMIKYVICKKLTEFVNETYYFFYDIRIYRSALTVEICIFPYSNISSYPVLVQEIKKIRSSFQEMSGK